MFGLAWHGVNENQAVNMGGTLLRWLKQENFLRVHIGSATINSEAFAGEKETTPSSKAVDGLLENTWEALRAASRRGPFAQCTYTSLINKKLHPLNIPPRAVRARFGALYRNFEKFAVVLMKQDREVGQKPEEVNLSKRV